MKDNDNKIRFSLPLNVDPIFIQEQNLKSILDCLDFSMLIKNKDIPQRDAWEVEQLNKELIFNMTEGRWDLEEAQMKLDALGISQENFASVFTKVFKSAKSRLGKAKVPPKKESIIKLEKFKTSFQNFFTSNAKKQRKHAENYVNKSLIAQDVKNKIITSLPLIAGINTIVISALNYSAYFKGKDINLIEGKIWQYSPANMKDAYNRFSRAESVLRRIMNIKDSAGLLGAVKELDYIGYQVNSKDRIIFKPKFQNFSKKASVEELGWNKSSLRGLQSDIDKMATLLEKYNASKLSTRRVKDEFGIAKSTFYIELYEYMSKIFLMSQNTFLAISRMVDDKLKEEKGKK